MRLGVWIPAFAGMTVMSGWRSETYDVTPT